jgi:hypothetical protein
MTCEAAWMDTRAIRNLNDDSRLYLFLINVAPIHANFEIKFASRLW